jgi:hypothetical protein
VSVKPDTHSGEGAVKRWGARIEGGKIVFLPGEYWVRASDYGAVADELKSCEQAYALLFKEHGDLRNAHDGLLTQLRELRGALELADSYIREHTDHHGDCELSQSDGDHPCTCDYGTARGRIDAALRARGSV